MKLTKKELTYENVNTILIELQTEYEELRERFAYVNLSLPKGRYNPFEYYPASELEDIKEEIAVKESFLHQYRSNLAVLETLNEEVYTEWFTKKIEEI